MTLAGRTSGHITRFNATDKSDNSQWDAVLNGSGPILGIDASGADNIWAVGSDNQLYASADRGANFALKPSPVGGTSQVWRGVSALSDSAVWAVGDGGRIAFWNGASFTTQNSGVGVNLYGVHARSADDVYAVGEGGTVLRYDGDDWSSVDLGFRYAINEDLHAIDATASGDLLIVGEDERILRGSTAAPSPRSDDFGKQWVREHPLTISATIKEARFLDEGAQTYQDAGLNVLAAGGLDYPEQARIAAAGDLPWIIQGTLAPKLDQANQYPGGIGYNVGDEPSRLEMERLADHGDYIKNQYPSALVYANAYPNYASAAQLYGDNSRPDYTYSQYLDDFIRIIQPDVLQYDHYPFTEGQRRGSDYFENLMIVREKAQAADIPYWGYVQAFERENVWRQPSASDMRMQVFSMLTAGYTGLQYYVYVKDNEVGLIDQNERETALYDLAASVNAEVANLGRSLRFLESTAVRFVAGQDTAGGTKHGAPAGLAPFTSGVGGDAHILDIAVTDNGAAKDGLIGLFTDDADQQYFMLTNLFQDAGLSAEDAALDFEIQFDSTVEELLHLDRLTGEQELITLSDDHRLLWTLPGGTGDLFKYNDGDFVVPEPGAMALLLVGAGLTALGRTRRSRVL